jgi:hypothetical protein
VKVQTTPNFFEEDVFSFHRVRHEEIENLHFANDSVISIKQFVGKLEEWEPEEGRKSLKSHPTITAASDSLVHLIRFVSNSTEMDPFKREGIPIVERQTLIREKNVRTFF